MPSITTLSKIAHGLGKKLQIKICVITIGTFSKGKVPIFIARKEGWKG